MPEQIRLCAERTPAEIQANIEFERMIFHPDYDQIYSLQKKGNLPFRRENS